MSSIEQRVLIELSKAQAERCRYLAFNRFYGKLNNVPYAGREGDENHQVGILGEYASGLYFSKPINEELYGARGDGNDSDLILGPWKINIKTASANHWDDPYLRFNTKEEFRQPIGILCAERPDGPRRVDICGWIWREDFMAKQGPGNFGYGDRVYVTQEHLTPIQELKMMLYDWHMGDQERRRI